MSQLPTSDCQPGSSDRLRLRVGSWRLGVVAALLVTSALGVVTAQRSTPSWPPAVRKTPEKAPVLSAEGEQKTIVVPPGYKIELVAKEPLVTDPIVIEFDADGRLWVLEM